MPLHRYEKRHERVLSLPRFVKRLLLSLVFSSAILSLALFIGVLGYHHFAAISWVDSILNASMILTGMGPVSPMPTDGAKIFASLYALFSGLVFVTVMGVTLAPLIHRILHQFHIDEKDLEG